MTGRRRLRVSRSIQEGLDVPVAVVPANQVEAWLFKVQTTNFEPSANETPQPEPGSHFLGPQHRLRAKPRIVINNEVLEVETRLWKNSQLHPLYFHAPP